MGTKKEELKNGCFAAAAKDEPLFVLRAQDITAPACVQTWINKNIKRLGINHPKIREAMRARDSMERWLPRKFPD